jgi:hypothetical protein
MKTRTMIRLRLCCAALLPVLCFVAPARAQSARLQIDNLDHLAARASETVDVNIDQRLMQLTAKFFNGKDPDEAKVKELISGLKGIYVKSFSFDKPGEYTEADVEAVRSQLRRPGWSRIVGVISKRDRENVEVYLLADGDHIGGLAILSAEPKELTIVNIVGPVDLEKLSRLEGQFGIPDFELERGKPVPEK